MDDDLGAARGIVIGIMLGVLGWMLFYLAYRMLL